MELSAVHFGPDLKGRRIKRDRYIEIATERDICEISRYHGCKSISPKTRVIPFHPCRPTIGRAARLVGDPIFRRHRPTPGLFHLLFTGRWFLKESLRNNYYRGQSLARIQRNRLFQERSKSVPRELSSVSRLLLSRKIERERDRWKEGVKIEERRM